MPKRFIGFLKGDENAVPGDYVVALVAIFGLLLIKLVHFLAI